MLLEIKDLRVAYGGLIAVSDVNINIGKGEKVALIGPNGAGKSTLVNAIAGLVKPLAGEIISEGEVINRLPPHIRVRKGIGIVLEGGPIFPRLSVLENIQVSASTKEAKEKFQDTLEWIYQLFPILKERSEQLAGTLSGGERRMLSIAMTLTSRPKLLVLDELSLGLAPIIVSRLYSTLSQLHEEGLTILLVEQYVKRALEFTDRAYLIERGKVTLEGPSLELLRNDYIRKAYVGI